MARKIDLLIPTTYAEAAAYLGKAYQRIINGNTVISRYSNETIALTYHDTDVVRYHEDRTISFSLQGWHTVTTVRRVNAALRRTPWSIHGLKDPQVYLGIEPFPASVDEWIQVAEGPYPHYAHPGRSQGGTS